MIPPCPYPLPLPLPLPGQTLCGLCAFVREIFSSGLTITDEMNYRRNFLNRLSRNRSHGKEIHDLLKFHLEVLLMRLEQAVLDKIVAVILQHTQPLKIVLFGSAARGELGPDSDIDIMVVVPEGVDGFQVAWSSYPKLTNLGVGVDLVIVTLSDLQKKQHDKSLVFHAALREGIELYAA